MKNKDNNADENENFSFLLSSFLSSLVIAFIYGFTLVKYNLLFIPLIEIALIIYFYYKQIHSPNIIFRLYLFFINLLFYILALSVRFLYYLIKQGSVSLKEFFKSFSGYFITPDIGAYLMILLALSTSVLIFFLDTKIDFLKKFKSLFK